MVAQLVDLFSRETWRWIYIVCFEPPLIGAIFGLTIWKGRGILWRVTFTTAFYTLTAFLILFPWTDPRLSIVLIGALLAGPLLAMLFLLPLPLRRTR